MTENNYKYQISIKAGELLLNGYAVDYEELQLQTANLVQLKEKYETEQRVKNPQISPQQPDNSSYQPTTPIPNTSHCALCGSNDIDIKNGFSQKTGKPYTMKLCRNCRAVNFGNRWQVGRNG